MLLQGLCKSLISLFIMELLIPLPYPVELSLACFLHLDIPHCCSYIFISFTLLVPAPLRFMTPSKCSCPLAGENILKYFATCFVLYPPPLTIISTINHPIHPIHPSYHVFKVLPDDCTAFVPFNVAAFHCFSATNPGATFFG